MQVLHDAYARYVAGAEPDAEAYAEATEFFKNHETSEAAADWLSEYLDDAMLGKLDDEHVAELFEDIEKAGSTTKVYKKMDKEVDFIPSKVAPGTLNRQEMVDEVATRLRLLNDHCGTPSLAKARAEQFVKEFLNLEVEIIGRLDRESQAVYLMKPANTRDLHEVVSNFIDANNAKWKKEAFQKFLKAETSATPRKT